MDRAGRKPTDYLNFGDRPINLPDGTVIPPLTGIKYLDIDGPQPVETNIPKNLLNEWSLKQCCYQPRTIVEGTPNPCWRTERSTCGRKDFWFDQWRENHAAEGRRT